MEIIAYKGRPFSVFVDGFVYHFALLQLYSNHLVLSLRNIEVESNDGSHIELLDALSRTTYYGYIATLVLRKPIYDTVFCIQMSCVLCSKLLDALGPGRRIFKKCALAR